MIIARRSLVFDTFKKDIANMWKILIFSVEREDFFISFGSIRQSSMTCVITRLLSVAFLGWGSRFSAFFRATFNAF